MKDEGEQIVLERRDKAVGDKNKQLRPLDRLFNSGNIVFGVLL